MIQCAARMIDRSFLSPFPPHLLSVFICTLFGAALHVMPFCFKFFSANDTASVIYLCGWLCSYWHYCSRSLSRILISSLCAISIPFSYPSKYASILYCSFSFAFFISSYFFKTISGVSIFLSKLSANV